MMIREPAVAGRFYPADRSECLQMVERCVDSARAATAASGQSNIENQTSKVLGAVVPHAGWICSGAIAARSILEIAEAHRHQTIIIFGAVHLPHGPRASIFSSGAWETPLGLSHIDTRLAERLCAQTSLLQPDAHAHESEHSIEVEIPFIQQLLPDARIIPIMVPPTEHASALGTAIGNACLSYKADVVFLASTDLTHYGTGYGFTPRGAGDAGLDWAKNVNDRRMIDLITALRDEAAVSEAIANQNACGPGAIAAAIAASKAMGATRAKLLQHTTSHEVLSKIRDEPACDAVGYAAMTLF